MKFYLNPNVKEILINPKLTQADLIIQRINKNFPILINTTNHDNYHNDIIVYDSHSNIISKLYQIEKDIITQLNKTNQTLEDAIVTKYLNFMSKKQLINNICDNCMKNESMKVLCYIGSVFIKKTIKLLNTILLEYKDNVDFGIPDILVNLPNSDDNYNINVIGINNFYKYIYQKILIYHLSKKYKKGYTLTIKKMNQININNYKNINSIDILDDSLEYLLELRISCLQ